MKRPSQPARISNISAEDRLIIVFSDIEMGFGGAEDDFPQSDFLRTLLDGYNNEFHKPLQLDLVFNGDTFDFLKTDLDGTYPHFIDEEVALIKLNRISSAHTDFFTGINQFVGYSPENRRVHFIVGNHDPELLFPSVQKAVKELCGAPENIKFPGNELCIGDVHIEHGNQHDALFSISVDQPFIHHSGKEILNLPWATVALLDVVMPLRGTLYHLDRIKPKTLLFERVPELKEWMLGSFWNYWAKNYIRDYLNASNPLKKISWAMVKEALRRSLFFNPDIEMERYFHSKMKTNDQIRLYCVGHAHEPHIWSYGDRKVIQSGCMRNEFMLGPDVDELRPIPKSFIEIHMGGNKVLTSNLIEIMGPPVPDGYVPRRLSDFIPIIHEKLGTDKERLQDKIDIEAQEERDREDSSI